MVHIHDEQGAELLVQELGVGDVIYYTWVNDLTTPEKVYDLSHFLQQKAQIPLLIGLLINLYKSYCPAICTPFNIWQAKAPWLCQHISRYSFGQND